MEAEPLKTEDLPEKPKKESRSKELGLMAMESGKAEKPKSKKSPEHIGHMLVTGPESKPAPKIIKNEKMIGTLSRAELLTLSEQIIIDGTSLRQIYETHLIGERGLRRLVSEYLKEGDLRKVLRQEIIEREIDFERDPLLRSRPPITVFDGISGKDKAKTDLDVMLAQATKNLPKESEEAAFYKAKAAYETQQLQQTQSQRRLVDISLVAVIVLLFILVAVLYFGRR